MAPTLWLGWLVGPNRLRESVADMRLSRDGSPGDDERGPVLAPLSAFVQLVC